MVMKVYSSEFKADAVALYLSDPSHTFEGIGKDLGVSRETLRNWVRAERETGRSSPGRSVPPASTSDRVPSTCLNRRRPKGSSGERRRATQTAQVSVSPGQGPSGYAIFQTGAPGPPAPALDCVKDSTDLCGLGSGVRFRPEIV
ncbi:transposase [Streptomyces sp. NPDC051219]|uniref:transposase n=1 Tax=Streptomyces sp. NPDC051219 TaxID=3155283 RepID=UPI00341C49BD